MNILVVNDDGYKSEGIKILAEAIKAYGNVTVVAPHKQQSAKSASITIHKKLKYYTHKGNIYSVKGTPSDCVKVALDQLKLKVDLIVSGINEGYNIGFDTIYSGTVGAAMEGLIHGIPAIAFSSDLDGYKNARLEIEDTLKWIFEHQLPSQKYVLNVNFQSRKFRDARGYRITNLDIYKEGSPYLEEMKDYGIEYTDRGAVSQGYISITPLKLGNGDPLLGKQLIESLRKE